MAAKRDTYTDDQHSILYAETGGICPLGKEPILYTKPGGRKLQKGYEIAHIYPLNPTPAQTAALAGHLAPADINGLRNVVVLCPNCHTRYDKQFQVAEYLALKEIKARFLSDAKARQSISKFALEEQVFEILDLIAVCDPAGNGDVALSFDISTIDQKLKTGISPLQMREIKSNAVDYYIRIRDYLKQLEQQDQYAVLLLQAQVKAYCFAMQRDHPDNKDLVFNYIAQWISEKTNGSLLASKILTSFFVQNCEIFSVDPH
ncbi:HNH endonuclease [Paraburkholderia dipogonis]|uniref:HNH endonuclease n=1 Tax=Paraburkholderia dipogonis TaxID=1211383 RepID=A0A4Y8MHN9_9BURK|nr:ABC-three component system protein [Paraburkholderia dipogonis]TFE37000.1 HNH endonuclease [Paraburkholderia dipogonis]